jgi:hypothetical protein
MLAHGASRGRTGARRAEAPAGAAHSRGGAACIKSHPARGDCRRSHGARGDWSSPCFAPLGLSKRSRRSRSHGWRRGLACSAPAGAEPCIAALTPFIAALTGAKPGCVGSLWTYSRRRKRSYSFLRDIRARRFPLRTATLPQPLPAREGSLNGLLSLVARGVSQHSRLTTRHSALATHRSPLITRHSPLTTHHSFSHGHCNALARFLCQVAQGSWP